jgi:anti-sigma regulatory factor (Ser/Thr protein kinase)
MGEMLVRHEPATASAVRHELALDLDLQGVGPDAIDDVTLVASELIGNAIRHASNGDRGAWTFSWIVQSGEVVISVEDPSTDLPVRRRPAPNAPSGRGLAIVETLSSDWGFERTDCGKRVWARVLI